MTSTMSSKARVIARRNSTDEGLVGKKKTSRSLVDEKLADWIYNAITHSMQPFDVVGPDLSELVNYITKYAPGDYVPPTAKRIRGELLDAAYERTREAASALLFGDLENKAALTAMSGGKTNSGKVPVVNYIAMSPGGNHFLGAGDMGRAEKDCASMAKYLHEKCVGTGSRTTPSFAPFRHFPSLHPPSR
jgi:hypothetical protein